MEYININSAGVVGQILSNPSTIAQILNDDFTFHYLPEAQIDFERKPDVFVKEELHDKVVTIDYPQIIISPMEDHRGLVSACDYLLERSRQEKLGVYSLNSSSVQKEGEAIIFFGGSTNLGKTSSALELAINGFELFSDEKTLLDLNNKQLYSGSKSIALRKKVLQKKLKSKREFLEFDESSCPQPNISMMILPHLDHGLEKPISYQLNQMDAFWHLNKELARRIRGDTKFIGNFQYSLQSIDNEELSLKRVEAIKNLTQITPIYYFQGSLNQLTDFVNERFNK